MANQNITSNSDRAGVMPADWQKWNIASFRDVRPVTNAAPRDRFLGIPVTGNSLKHLGILHGDILITKLAKDFTENDLCVWRTPLGRTVKFASEDCAEITLHNRGEWRETFFRNEVELIGIAVRVERDIGKGSFTW